MLSHLLQELCLLHQQFESFVLFGWLFPFFGPAPIKAFVLNKSSFLLSLLILLFVVFKWIVFEYQGVLSGCRWNRRSRWRLLPWSTDGWTRRTTWQTECRAYICNRQINLKLFIVKNIRLQDCCTDQNDLLLCRRTRVSRPSLRLETTLSLYLGHRPSHLLRACCVPVFP